jgi:hypothetical protein
MRLILARYYKFYTTLKLIKLNAKKTRPDRQRLPSFLHECGAALDDPDH